MMNSTEKKRYILSLSISLILILFSIIMFYHARGYLTKYMVAASFEIIVAAAIFLYSLYLFRKTLRKV